jgi:hypothetical protein
MELWQGLTSGTRNRRAVVGSIRGEGVENEQKSSEQRWQCQRRVPQGRTRRNDGTSDYGTTVSSKRTLRLNPVYRCLHFMMYTASRSLRSTRTSVARGMREPFHVVIRVFMLSVLGLQINLSTYKYNLSLIVTAFQKIDQAKVWHCILCSRLLLYH